MGLNWKFSLMVLGCLLSASVAKAGSTFELEPYAGYASMGTLGTASQFTAKTEAKYSAVMGGARATLKIANFLSIGPDFSYQYGLSATAPGLTFSSGNAMRLGAVAGIRLPMSLRLWFGYNFIDNNSATFSSATLGTVTQAYTGSSMKVGAGFRLISSLRLNAEYFFMNYTSLKQTALGTTTTTALSGASLTKGNMLLVSLSLPL